ncbi:MAG: ShlB/FhaC/HecB family hemolysin secretion/activation protein, partial [Pseudanabaenaceae cyanobacterium]
MGVRNLLAKAIGGGLLLLCHFPCLGQEPERIIVKNFNIVGGTVFSRAELEAITKPFTGRPLTFTELQQVSQAITQLYIDRGYITSGAYIPAQTPQNGTVTIQVIEGRLEKIKVEGVQRLLPSYIIDRVQTPTPLNRNDLLQALQLLQLNPRIQAINSELSPSPLEGKSILEVTVTEAPTFSSTLTLDNQRSPGVGEFRRQLQLQELNLSGRGDTLTLAYTNTDGSNLYELGYTLPLNPQDGTLGFHYSQSNSQVLEPPFSDLDILANARTYELAYRQPLYRSPDRAFALGIALTRSESETALLSTPFPLSPGADMEGRTRVTAVRLRQEYEQRSTQDVLALRSELSLGVQPFALNTNDLPQNSFFALWRGQAQYVKQLATNTQLIGRLNGQLASQALVAIEQFSLGGVKSVRG